MTLFSLHIDYGSQQLVDVKYLSPLVLKLLYHGNPLVRFPGAPSLAYPTRFYHDVLAIKGLSMQFSPAPGLDLDHNRSTRWRFGYSFKA